LAAALLCGAVAVLASGCSDGASASEATIGIRYSVFAAEELTFRVGEPVTFTLENGDPIEHEWIVGTEEVHERHRTGTEPFHDAIPTEVTIPPLTDRTTTVTFDEPGVYSYICHLPGHESYGMTGTLRVIES
jgi:uncharacterized cupredoxin-like copper-binding protein